MNSHDQKFIPLEDSNLDISSQIAELSYIEPFEHNKKVFLLYGEELILPQSYYCNITIEILANSKVYLLYLTNYRIYLSSTSDNEIVSIPYSYIRQCCCYENQIRLLLKTSLKIFLVPEQKTVSLKIHQILKIQCNSPPFCFSFLLDVNETQIYDCLAQMDRMLIKWNHISAIKNNGGIHCSSYPKTFFVPTKLNSEIAIECTKTRVNARIPALSYYLNEKGIALWRCGRTVSEHKSRYDYSYLESISQNLLIIQLQENDNQKDPIYSFNHFNNHIKYSAFKFDSITQVKTNYQKALFSFLKNQNILKNFGKWFEQIDQLIKYTFKVVEHLTGKRHVLIEENDPPCSENNHSRASKGGIDRASQLCALTSTILDPYYRTIKGLLVLIQKDFVSFGYPFAERTGTESNKKNQELFTKSIISQKSPNIHNLLTSVYSKQTNVPKLRNFNISVTFIQFLECIHQLINCYPTQFEYSGQFLAYLGYELFSGKYNNFLFDTFHVILGLFKEKQSFPDIKKTMSFCRFKAMRKQYFNMHFNPSKEKQLSNLRSCPSLKEYVIWKEYWEIVTKMNADESEKMQISQVLKQVKILKQLLSHKKSAKQHQNYIQL